MIENKAKIPSFYIFLTKTATAFGVNFLLLRRVFLLIFIDKKTEFVYNYYIKSSHVVARTASARAR